MEWVSTTLTSGGMAESMILDVFDSPTPTCCWSSTASVAGASGTKLFSKAAASSLFAASSKTTPRLVALGIVDSVLELRVFARWFLPDLLVIAGSPPSLSSPRLFLFLDIILQRRAQMLN